MTAPVYWLNLYPETVLTPGMWDETILTSWLLKDWPKVDTVPHEGGVVVIPGRFHHLDIAEINALIAPMAWCLIVVTSDEEGTFDTRRLSHPNMRIWAQTPGPGFTGRILPLGWTPHALNLPSEPPQKTLDWFFAGQVTHERRQQLRQAITDLIDANTELSGHAIFTEGFTQGLPPDEYMAEMMSAKVVPCPSGPVHVETFRVYEALEAGAVPITDRISPRGPSDYWVNTGLSTLPWLQNWADAPQLIKHMAWLDYGNTIQGMWLRFKTDLQRRFARDLADLSGIPRAIAPIQVVILTSPIPSHPSTVTIDQTIESVKEQLPDAPILLLIDGVRPEQEDLRDAYEEYVRRILWKCNHAWKAMSFMFSEFTHQAGMLRQALDEIESPTILFVEHDTPLRGEIPWELMTPLVANGDLDVIRLSHEASIHPEHRALMVDLEPITIGDLPIIRTRQFSARPHLARTDWYRGVLSKWFAPDARCFIEDRLYWVVLETGSWIDHKLALYAPPGNMSRSWHSDGRQGAPKFDESQTW